MKKLICFIAALMLSVTTASAESLMAYVTTDELTGSITVNGSGAAYGGQLVSILIQDGEKGFFSPDIPLITEAVHAFEDGGFEIIINPSLPLPGGEYAFKAVTFDDEFETKFIVVSKEGSSQLFEILKKCEDAIAIGNCLEGRYFDIGISEELGTKYHEALTNRIFNGIGECKDATDFVKLCRSAVAILRILDGEEISDVLLESKNSMYVDNIACIDMWQALSEKAKKEAMNLYRDSNNPSESFSEACALSAVKTSENWRELSDVLSPFDENVFTKVFKLDTSYCTKKNQDAVIQLVFKKLSDINSISDMKNTFLKESKNYSSKSKGNSSSGSSQSGSSGSGSIGTVGSSISVSSDFYDIKEEINFTDINGHWGEKYIKQLGEKGIVKGYEDGGFHPDSNVTRAEFVTMLCAGFGIVGGNGGNTFSDVDESQWYAESVNACRSRGIVFGDDNNCFNPHNLITREDAAVMLYRILSEKIEIEEMSQIPFNDGSEISEYAVNAVALMAEEGVLTGNDSGYFNPKENTTRAQAAVMLIKTVDFINAAS